MPDKPSWTGVVMKRVVLLVASALLAGCNSSLPDVEFLLNDPAVSSVTPESGTPPSGPGAPDSANEGPEVALRAHANRPAPLPKRKPDRIVGIEPEKLVGMTRDQVTQLIGIPKTVVDKPPATVWSYHSSVCALEIFFYLDVGSKTFRALTYQVKSEGGAAIAPTLCLGQIRAVTYGS